MSKCNCFCVNVLTPSALPVDFKLILQHKDPYKVSLGTQSAYVEMIMVMCLDNIFLHYFVDSKPGNSQDLTVNGVFPNLVSDLMLREGSSINAERTKDPERGKKGGDRLYRGARGALVLAAFAGFANKEIFREAMAIAFLNNLKGIENWVHAFYTVGVVTFGQCKECDGKLKSGL